MATYRGQAEEIGNGVRSAKEQAKKSARRVKNVAAEEGQAMGERLQGLAEESGKMAREAYDYGRERVEAGAETARGVVKERPLLAMAGAFLGGAVLAALMRR